MLAEGRQILIDAESRPVRRQLEQHSPGLQKVDRFEPEPIDDFGRASPRQLDALTHLELGFQVGNSPRHVVHSARSPPSALAVRYFLDLEIASRSSIAEAESGPVAFGSQVHEAECSGEEAGSGRQVALPQPYRME